MEHIKKNSSKAFLASTSKTFGKVSLNGKYLAYVYESSVTIIAIKNCSLAYEFRCIDRVWGLEWSPDSEFLMCIINNRATVQVFSLEHPDWRCTIDQGCDGLHTAYWSPDSRHVLTLVDLHLWVSVWSLSNRKVKVVEKIKQCQPSLSFSNDGQYLALVESSGVKERLLLLNCSTWSVHKRLQLSMSDIAGFAWSSNCSELCIWDGPCGCHLNVINIDGKLMAHLKLESNVLGVEWGKQLMCAACVDNSVLVVNCLTWNVMTRLQHMSHLPRSEHLTVYQEVEQVKESVIQALANLNLKPNTASNKLLNGNFNSKSLKYQLAESDQFKIPLLNREELTNPLHCCGVAAMALCYDSNLLATQSFHAPHVLWIWDLHKFSLQAVLVHQTPIKCMQWEPRGNRLVVCTTSQPLPHLFVWTPKEARAVAIPALGSESLIHSQWHRNKDIIIVSSRNKMLIYHLNN